MTRPSLRRGQTRIIAASILTCGGLLLSGCVGNASAPAANNRLSKGPQPGQAAQLTVLSQFGDNAALQGVLDRLNADYHKKHPEVTVKIQYLTLDDLTKTVPTTLASGSGPDIIDYDANEASLGALAKSHLVLSLDDAATRYSWKSKMSASALARTTYGGKLYGVGRSSEAVGLYYNADLFDRLGIAPPTSYAAFTTAAAALKRAGITPITFGNKDLWPSSHLIGAALHADVPVARIGGFERLSGDGTWSDPAVLSALTTAQSWVRSGWVTPNFNGVSFDDAGKQFYASKAGMFIEGTGVTPDVLQNMPKVNVRFVSFPMIDTKLPQQAEGGVGGAWAISAGSKAPAIAANWIDFIHFSSEAEQAWLQAGVLPTTTYQPPATVDLAPLVRDNLTVVHAAQSGGGIGYWTGYSSSPLVTDAWDSGAQRFLDGSMSAAQFADQLQQALTASRAQAGK